MEIQGWETNFVSEQITIFFFFNQPLLTLSGKKNWVYSFKVRHECKKIDSFLKDFIH